MKTTKSISFITGFFTYFLLATAWNHIDSPYIPLKQNIADGNFSSAIMLGIELLSLIVLGICVIKIVININKKRFFIKQNHTCFFIMGISLYLPVLAYAIIGFMGQECPEIDHALYLCGGTFLFILAEIFRYGYHLKEEQDLTI